MSIRIVVAGAAGRMGQALIHAITQVWKLSRYTLLTHDRGTSKLSQGPSSGTNMVEIERWTEPLPPVRAFEPPAVAAIS